MPLLVDNGGQNARNGGRFHTWWWTNVHPYARALVHMTLVFANAVVTRV